MDQGGFQLWHLPFWIINYGLAALAWTAIGRFLLGGFVQEGSRNYIWRAFVALSAPALAFARLLSPRAIGDRLLPLVAAFWMFVLRIAAFLLLFHAGLVPRISSGG
jgi:uncharacterized protein YggT (Ycf19 family)